MDGTDSLIDATDSVEILAGTLNVDGSSATDALTDGIIVIKYLFGFTGQVLVENATAVDSTRSTSEIELLLLQMHTSKLFDVDGDGNQDALTDGILVIKHLFGFTGSTLTSNALGAGATRTDSEITNYLTAIQQ